mmetsp:Transcript_20718/g.33004  ORF Transcript_20718/g.33004 Transcript_20718/m.33004 type:complete len:204 (+) Transcript_20718:292-903(+)
MPRQRKLIAIQIILGAKRLIPLRVLQPLLLLNMRQHARRRHIDPRHRPKLRWQHTVRFLRWLHHIHSILSSCSFVLRVFSIIVCILPVITLYIFQKLCICHLIESVFIAAIHVHHTALISTFFLEYFLQIMHKRSFDASHRRLVHREHRVFVLVGVESVLEFTHSIHHDVVVGILFVGVVFVVDAGAHSFGYDPQINLTRSRS